MRFTPGIASPVLR